MSRRIIGNTVGTPTPRSDWNQTNPLKADFIKNKPDVSLKGIGAAPAGYGLGEDFSKLVTTPDEAVLNGFYCIFNNNYDGDGSFSDWRLGYAQILVQRRGSYIVQTLRFEDTEWQRFSSDEGNTWSPFEWVNPPMAADVEYRTTERYLNKPVYRKLVTYELGATVPSGSSIAFVHGIADLDSIVRYYGKIGTDVLPYMDKDGGQVGLSNIYTNSLVLGVHGKEYSSGSRVRLILCYTKTS